ncbi:unnamed protein product [Cuscuta campestris]|uniref:Prephenate/arogenate dehydrogenase domain-containing protein n=1 Tax=Cuscuta campestris TaxID=132261 RepID=A0A484M1Z2_9ASTE|nr:unnamed protein product [Cuscuta campestris]
MCFTILQSLPNRIAATAAGRPSLPFSGSKCQTRRSRLRIQRGHATGIRTVDAAQHSGYKSQGSSIVKDSGKLRIAVIGFGNFGQFLAKTFVQQGHFVMAHSRSDYSRVARSIGAAFYADPRNLCEQHPDVILLCTSIISAQRVLRSLPVQRLRPSTLFVDVLSVKEFPKNIFLQVLPNHFDILCTHPMFGPTSGRHGWRGLPFVFDKVRIGEEESRVSRAEKFLDIFAKEGWRLLEKLGLETTPVNTKGYEALLDLVESTSGDSFDLYYGLFMYNKNAMEQLERLDSAFELLKKELFRHFHNKLGKQLFDKVEQTGE